METLSNALAITYKAINTILREGNNENEEILKYAKVELEKLTPPKKIPELTLFLKGKIKNEMQKIQFRNLWTEALKMVKEDKTITEEKPALVPQTITKFKEAFEGFGSQLIGQANPLLKETWIELLKLQTALQNNAPELVQKSKLGLMNLICDLIDKKETIFNKEKLKEKDQVLLNNLFQALSKENLEIDPQTVNRACLALTEYYRTHAGDLTFTIDYANVSIITPIISATENIRGTIDKCRESFEKVTNKANFSLKKTHRQLKQLDEAISKKKPELIKKLSESLISSLEKLIRKKETIFKKTPLENEEIDALETLIKKLPNFYGENSQISGSAMEEALDIIEEQYEIEAGSLELIRESVVNVGNQVKELSARSKKSGTSLQRSQIPFSQGRTSYSSICKLQS